MLVCVSTLDDGAEFGFVIKLYVLTEGLIVSQGGVYK